jgi:hypothetical protein
VTPAKAGVTLPRSVKRAEIAAMNCRRASGISSPRGSNRCLARKEARDFEAIGDIRPPMAFLHLV